MSAATNHGVISARAIVRDGRTELADIVTRAPLKVAPARTNHDGSAAVVVMECSPGMLPGDSYDLDWVVEPGARLHIGTQSHLRAHGGAAGADVAPARLRQRVRAGGGALVELLPEPVVPHANADWRGDTHVELDGDACAVIGELATVGRAAHGEVLRFRRWSSRLEVRVNGELVAAGRQLLEPGVTGRDEALQLLGGATHWGSLHVVGAALDAGGCERLRAAFDAALAASTDVRGAVDVLDRFGVVVVLRARSSWAATQVLRALANVVSENSTPVGASGFGRSPRVARAASGVSVACD